MTMAYLALAVLALAALVAWVIVRQVSQTTNDHDINTSSDRAETRTGPAAWN